MCFIFYLQQTKDTNYPKNNHEWRGEPPPFFARIGDYVSCSARSAKKTVKQRLRIRPGPTRNTAPGQQRFSGAASGVTPSNPEA